MLSEFCEEWDLTEVGRESPHVHREPDASRGWPSRGAVVSNSDCIVKALEDGNVLREDQEGRQRQKSSLLAGEMLVLSLLPLGTLERAKQMGSGNPEGTFQAWTLER